MKGQNTAVSFTGYMLYYAKTYIIFKQTDSPAVFNRLRVFIYIQ